MLDMLTEYTIHLAKLYDSNTSRERALAPDRDCSLSDVGLRPLFVKDAGDSCH